MDDKDEEIEAEISDRFVHFIHDTKDQARELCRELKKILHRRKIRLRGRKKK